uniref:Uncharacterized protein n=1 Tax=Cacopsylla melanoneura TaxID=428564 RepID=A0A8D8UUS6_9HEMI
MLLSLIIERRDESYAGNKVRNIEVPGRRGVVKPKKTWRNYVIEDMREKGVRRDDETQDRDGWKRYKVEDIREKGVRRRDYYETQDRDGLKRYKVEDIREKEE